MASHFRRDNYRAIRTLAAVCAVDSPVSIQAISSCLARMLALKQRLATASIAPPDLHRTTPAARQRLCVRVAVAQARAHTIQVVEGIVLRRVTFSSKPVHNMLATKDTPHVRVALAFQGCLVRYGVPCFLLLFAVGGAGVRVMVETGL